MAAQRNRRPDIDEADIRDESDIRAAGKTLKELGRVGSGVTGGRRLARDLVEAWIGTHVDPVGYRPSLALPVLAALPDNFAATADGQNQLDRLLDEADARELIE